jgi:hypothetical protein
MTVLIVHLLPQFQAKILSQTVSNNLGLLGINGDDGWPSGGVSLGIPSVLVSFSVAFDDVLQCCGNADPLI